MMNQDGFGVFNWDDLHATMNRFCTERPLQDKQSEMVTRAMKIKSDSINFSKYGKTFQEKLCMVILDDRSFADQIEDRDLRGGILELHGRVGKKPWCRLVVLRCLCRSNRFSAGCRVDQSRFECARGLWHEP